MRQVSRRLFLGGSMALAATAAAATHLLQSPPPIPEGAIPTGYVLPFAGKDIPPGFLRCHGQSLSVLGYGRLFDVIGFSYGGSRADATFRLPDFRAPRIVARSDSPVQPVMSLDYLIAAEPIEVTA